MARAVQQPDLKSLLDLTDTPGYCGLSHMQTLSRPAETAQLDDPEENLEGAQIDHE